MRTDDPTTWNAMSPSPSADHSPSKSGRRSRAPRWTSRSPEACTTSATASTTSPLTRSRSARAQLDDFTDGYDTCAAAPTARGYLATAFRCENPAASAGQNSPRYATIYDIVTSDPATAWPDTEHSPDYPTHLFSDPRAKLVAPVLRASYALVGSQARPGEHGRLTGIHVVLSNGGGDPGRQPPDAQGPRAGLFYSAPP